MSPTKKKQTTRNIQANMLTKTGGMGDKSTKIIVVFAYCFVYAVLLLLYTCSLERRWEAMIKPCHAWLAPTIYCLLYYTFNGDDNVPSILLLILMYTEYFVP